MLISVLSSRLKPTCVITFKTEYWDMTMVDNHETWWIQVLN